jgi:hypothetical protein
MKRLLRTCRDPAGDRLDSEPRDTNRVTRRQFGQANLKRNELFLCSRLDGPSSSGQRSSAGIFISRHRRPKGCCGKAHSRASSGTECCRDRFQNRRPDLPHGRQRRAVCLRSMEQGPRASRSRESEMRLLQRSWLGLRKSSAFCLVRPIGLPVRRRYAV